MHVSKAELPAITFGEYDGRMVDWGDDADRVRVDALATSRPTRRRSPASRTTAASARTGDTCSRAPSA